jgi:hypothetical protein
LKSGTLRLDRSRFLSTRRVPSHDPAHSSGDWSAPDDPRLQLVSQGQPSAGSTTRPPLARIAAGAFRADSRKMTFAEGIASQHWRLGRTYRPMGSVLQGSTKSPLLINQPPVRRYYYRPTGRLVCRARRLVVRRIVQLAFVALSLVPTFKICPRFAHESRQTNRNKERDQRKTPLYSRGFRGVNGGI